MKRCFLLWVSFLLTLSICILPARADVEAQKELLSDALADLQDGSHPKGTLLSLIESSRPDKTQLQLYDLPSKLTVNPDGTTMYGLSSRPHSLLAVNRRAPFTNLHRLSDDIVYTVYQMCGQDHNLYYVYVFFESLDPTVEGIDPSTESWWMTDRVFFVHNILSFEDFSEVAPGSTAAFVTDIDPAAGLQLLNPETASAEIEEQTTCHYLTDGILYLTYRFDASVEALTVTDIRFDPTFTLTGLRGTTHSLPCVLPAQQENYGLRPVSAEIQELLNQRWDRVWSQPGTVFYATLVAKQLPDKTVFSEIKVGSTTASKARAILGAPHLFVYGGNWKEAYCTTDGYLMVLDHADDGVLRDILVYHPQWGNSRSWTEFYVQPRETPRFPYGYMIAAAVVLSACLCGVLIYRRRHRC